MPSAESAQARLTEVSSQTWDRNKPHTQVSFLYDPLERCISKTRRQSLGWQTRGKKVAVLNFILRILDMPPLENYYTGDGKWIDFSGFYSENYLDDTARKLARELDGHLDIAVVIYGLLGQKESFEWIYKKIPALDNISPKCCLKNESLLKRLKTTLMRMPC